MLTEPASRLLLLAMDAIQREATMHINALVTASAESEHRLVTEWQFDFGTKHWVQKKQSV